MITVAWSAEEMWIRDSLGVVTLPVVRENKLEGLIVTGDIAKSYMDVYDLSLIHI